MLADGLDLIEKGRLLRTVENSGSTLPSTATASDRELFEVKGSVVITNGVYIFNAQMNKWVLVENTEFDVYDIGLTIFDRPRSLDVVCKHIAARTFVIKPGFEGSIAHANIAATDVTVFQVQIVNGNTTTNVGTLTFAADSEVGVFSTVENLAIVVARGQILRIVSPEIRDATLSSIDVTISGELLVPR